MRLSLVSTICLPIPSTGERRIFLMFTTIIANITTIITNITTNITTIITNITTIITNITTWGEQDLLDVDHRAEDVLLLSDDLTNVEVWQWDCD